MKMREMFRTKFNEKVDTFLTVIHPKALSQIYVERQTF